LYYVDYEPQNCFIALDSTSDKAIGYVLSSLDTLKQSQSFKRKMIPKIFFRLYFYTIWRYRKSYKVISHLRKIARKAPKTLNEDELIAEYPAHLHIDILPEYHRQGIGRKLIERLESHLREHGSTGVHLGTSEQNTKALPFYKSLGFEIFHTSPPGFGMWPDAVEVRSITFVKKIHE
jgi:ribosomal protein S18 acetylase RimI-like enzyme